MKVATARGFRDVLPQEAAERETIADAVGRIAHFWGYERVETPVLEEYSLLQAASGTPEGAAFRLLDLDGELLALRPEMTVPVARLAASRLLDSERPAPLRLRYAAPVFREHESLQGQARQFTQIGIELLGATGSDADAEVVVLAIRSLLAAGLAEHTVAIGTVAVLSSVLRASDMPEEWRRAVLGAAHARDLVGLERLAASPEVAAPVAAALREVPRLRGGAEAIARCRELTGDFGCGEALDALASVYDVVAALGLTEHVLIDFGVMRDFDYYTGMVLEAYAPGVGAPVGGGGRYDNVLAAFGAPAPAAGFALGLERLQLAASAQSALPTVAGLDDILSGDALQAFSAAEALRATGRRVQLACGCAPPEVAALAARRGARGLLASARELLLLAEDGSIAESLPWPGEAS